MKTFEARDQVALGPVRAVMIALSGMRYRLSRSLVTTSILALAVAFLIHMVAYSVMEQRVVGQAAAELREARRAAELFSRATRPDAPAEVQRVLARGAGSALTEYQRWTALDEAALSAAMVQARRLVDLRQWIDALPPALRATLLQGRSSSLWLRQVGGGSDVPTFQQVAAQAGLQDGPPGGWAPLEALVASGFQPLDAITQQIVAGHARALDEIAAAMPDELSTSPPAADAAIFVEAMHKAGFMVKSTDQQAIARELTETRLRMSLETALRDPQTRQDVAAAFREELAAVDPGVILERTDDLADARRGLALLGLPESMESDLLALAQRDRRLTSLRRVVPADQADDGQAADVAEVDASGGVSGGGGTSGGGGVLSVRAWWLLGLSLLVCMVGVTNAMLMSVTERFTEIATLKCLGAMDGSVLALFVVEAVTQGVLGAVVGVLLGLGLAVLRGWWLFGGLLGFAGSAVGDVVWLSLAAAAGGVVLAVLAAVAPSIFAARLAPMEAMRVE